MRVQFLPFQGAVIKRLPLLCLVLLGVFALGACSDSVMEPDTALSTQGAEEGSSATNMNDKGNAPAPGDLSIAEIAIDAGFDSLVAALTYVDEAEDDGGQDAGLVDFFTNGTDQFTVFAPTNEAFEDLFAALSADDTTQVEGIRDLPSDLVLDVLLYHVTEGRRGSNSVVPPVKPRVIETLLGQTFSVDSDGVITTPSGNMASFVPDSIDISASNGIIHVIDAVLVPEL